MQCHPDRNIVRTILCSNCIYLIKWPLASRLFRSPFNRAQQGEMVLPFQEQDTDRIMGIILIFYDFPPKNNLRLPDVRNGTDCTKSIFLFSLKSATKC